MPSSALVTGLNNNQYNGIYNYEGILNGRSSYRLNEDTLLYFFEFIETKKWVLSGPIDYCEVWEDVNYPWEITGEWIDVGIDPTGITILEATPINLRNFKYTTATEAGAVRFRRLVGLGYV